MRNFCRSPETCFQDLAEDAYSSLMFLQAFSACWKPNQTEVIFFNRKKYKPPLECEPPSDCQDEQIYPIYPQNFSFYPLRV